MESPSIATVKIRRTIMFKPINDNWSTTTVLFSPQQKLRLAAKKRQKKNSFVVRVGLPGATIRMRRQQLVCRLESPTLN